MDGRLMDNEAILALARERMTEAEEADRQNREEAQDDIEHLIGRGQWAEDVKRQREQDGRPCLTINRLPQFARQVTGDIRNLNPAVKVLAADGEATEQVADIYSGMIRHIEYQSDASSVYERAAESAAQCGIGWFRVDAEYSDDESFDQELFVRGIRNAMSVYADPSAQLPTKADGQFVFVTEQMGLKAFEKAYPDAQPIDADHDGVTDGLEMWRNEGSVVVAEYFWKEPVEKEIGLLEDGTVIEDWQPPLNPVKTRKVKTHKLMWAKITGNEVLEGPIEYPKFKELPVICVPGEEVHAGTEVYRSSVIRFAKDPQRIYNYASSADVEVVALQPKAPFIATPNQLKGYEADWANANNENSSVLYYTPDPKAAGAPERSTPPVSSQGLGQLAMKASEDMKATTGIYDAGLGNRSNESSGVAIRQRQMEGDISTSIYTDNLSKAIEQAGRVFVERIPVIYDTARIVRIVGEDDQREMVAINGLIETETGPEPVNALAQGKYDVRVSVGPNYTTRRQETSDSMMKFIQAYPNAAPLIGDLIAKAQEWPDAEKIAERLRKGLPPGILSIEEMPDEQQQQIAQVMQMWPQIQQMMSEQGQVELRKSAAEASEAEADAQKAGFEAQREQLELAQMSGEMNAAIVEIVRAEVARALQGAMQPGFAPI